MTLFIVLLFFVAFLGLLSVLERRQIARKRRWMERYAATQKPSVTLSGMGSVTIIHGRGVGGGGGSGRAGGGGGGAPGKVIVATELVALEREMERLSLPEDWRRTLRAACREEIANVRAQYETGMQSL